MKTLNVLLAALVLSAALFSGCTGSSNEQKASTDTTVPFVDDVVPDQVANITDMEVLLIEENDTVEIGEMI
jgi:hypothetical protein